MSDIIECPHCGSRIIPMAGGKCPSCQKDTGDHREIEKSNKMDAIYSIVGEGYKEGKAYREIVNKCIEAGYNEDLISETIKEYKCKEEGRLFGLITLGFWSGIGFLLIGVTVTFVTVYFSAVTGVAVLAYGCIGVGLLNMAVSQRLSWKLKRSLGGCGRK